MAWRPESSEKRTHISLESTRMTCSRSIASRSSDGAGVRRVTIASMRGGADVLDGIADWISRSVRLRPSASMQARAARYCAEETLTPAGLHQVVSRMLF